MESSVLVRISGWSDTCSLHNSGDSLLSEKFLRICLVAIRFSGP